MKKITKETDVLVFGHACVDIFALVEKFPAENTKIPFKQTFIEGGGQGANGSCCISKLGGKAKYITELGNDNYGKFVLKSLIDYGVDTSSIKIIDGLTTPVSYIFITEKSGNRTIIYEQFRPDEILIDKTITEYISNAKVLLLDPETTYLAKQIKNIKKRGLIVYDCELYRDGIQDIFNIADYFIPSIDIPEDKNLHIKGSSLLQKIKALKSLIKGKLIITDGKNGAYFLSEENVYQVIPPDVAIKDTTGAGDNFHAAFAFAVAKGFDLPMAVKFSIAVATYSCREYGSGKGIPDYKEAIEVAKGLDIIKVLSI